MAEVTCVCNLSAKFTCLESSSSLGIQREHVNCEAIPPRQLTSDVPPLTLRSLVFAGRR
jgi:hypothetical protein